MRFLRKLEEFLVDNMVKLGECSIVEITVTEKGWQSIMADMLFSETAHVEDGDHKLPISWLKVTLANSATIIIRRQNAEKT